MRKNILKILLLTLLTISFISSANAFGIKKNSGLYECYILIDAPADDPDCIDPETGLRDSICLIESSNRFIRGNDEMEAFISSLTDSTEFGCRPIK